MGLSVDEFLNAINSLKVAKSLLDDSLKLQPQQNELHKALQDACIQRFEFCIELAWKVSIKKLGLDTKAPNPAIRDMAQNKLIEDTDTWFEFLAARNKTSHTYDESIAKEVYATAIKSITELEKLVLKLK